VHERLQDGCIPERTRALAEVLSARIIGQSAAVDSLICSFSRLLAGLRDPARPALTFLLLGPTGVGKTETAKALVYLLKLPGLQRKLRAASDWTLDLFFERDVMLLKLNTMRAPGEAPLDIRESLSLREHDGQISR
jgi:hypothetical protein